MAVLNEAFFIKYINADERLNDPFYVYVPPDRRLPSLELKTFSVKCQLEEGYLTMDLIVKILIFSLIQKIIFNFYPENVAYFNYYMRNSISFGCVVYKHKFSFGSDALFNRLFKRYGLNFSQDLEDGIDDYIEFFKLIIKELDPLMITGIENSLTPIISHESFKCEFSEDSNTFSNKFYQKLKLSINAR